MNNDRKDSWMLFEDGRKCPVTTRADCETIIR